MVRKADLEQSIRESYQIVHQYESIIRTSDRPEEKLRARRVTAEQWQLVRDYLAEYRPLVDGKLPEEIAQIAARFESLDELIKVEQTIEAQEQLRGVFSSEQFEAMQSPLREKRQAIHDQLWERLHRLPPLPSIFSNLPQMLGEFVGREKDKVRVYEGLTSCPLVCIEGMGGIGKTSLALAVAAECLAARKGDQAAQGLPFFDGFIWATSREQALTLDDLLNTVARTLGYPGVVSLSLGDKRSEVCSLLQSAPHLLIVDNLDTIADPAVSDFLHKLPKPSKALLTSRVPKIERAWRVSLKGLDEDEALALIRNEGKRCGLPAVAEAKDEALLQLCRATSGAPLAIIWAVGQISRGLLFDQILEYLREAQGDVFSHVFERSWQLLSPEAKQVLMAVTLFAASALRAGVEAVSQVHGFALDDALGQLVELSLVELINPLQHDKQRYTIHPLTRAFAAKMGYREQRSTSTMLDRMVAYYKQVLTPPPDRQTGDPYWDGLGNFERADSLEPECDNLVHLIRSLLEKQRGNQALALFLPAVHLLHFWGLWQERLEFGYALCKAAHERGDPVEAWLWIDAVGYVLRQQDRFDECLDALNTGRSRAGEYNLGEAIMLAEVYEASAYARRGEVDQAARKVEQVVKQLDLPAILACETSLQCIVARRIVGIAASLSRTREDWAQAKEWYQIELQLRRLIHDNLAPSWSGLASIHLELGDLEIAEQLLSDAAAIASQKDLAWVYYEGARLAEKKGDLARSLHKATDALDLFRRLGQKSGTNRCEALLRRLQGQALVQSPKRTELDIGIEKSQARFCVVAARFATPEGSILKMAGFVTREMAHTCGIPHATVLLVPVSLNQAGDLTILTHWRPVGKETDSEKWDTFGGHVEVIAKNSALELPLNWDSPETMRFLVEETALREANEEIRLIGFQFTAARLYRFGGYGDFESGTQEPGSSNVEYSTVFIVVLPQDRADVQAVDTVTKDAAEVEIYNLPTQVWTIGALLSEYVQNPHRFADGLGRILSRLSKQPELRQRFQDLALKAIREIGSQ